MIWSNKVSFLVVTTLVVTVAIFDLRERRIPNFLIFPAIFWGIAWNTFGLGLIGALSSLKGLGAGAGILLIPYLVKGMKAGDVKFAMAIGTFTGAAGVIRVLLVTFLCYPLLAAIVVFRENKLIVTWLRFRQLLFSFLGFFLPSFKLYSMQLESSDDQSVASATTPFGVALAAGALVSVYTDFLKHLL
ncbi:MAG TPA: A24 family peptidase [Blastocatellia bacterium]|nr:A24 family peptidase [Blastocatellia bacterium]HMX24542.1 A24 family peptidase [Blastocatellia bacterium]HMZ17190.1 A24 family peptidase [Blastocatellia bacterium]HNG31883.1 A24 family peptidase [Blastocatellia bacterium]